MYVAVQNLQKWNNPYILKKQTIVTLIMIIIIIL